MITLTLTTTTMEPRYDFGLSYCGDNHTQEYHDKYERLKEMQLKQSCEIVGISYELIKRLRKTSMDVDSFECRIVAFANDDAPHLRIVRRYEFKAPQMEDNMLEVFTGEHLANDILEVRHKFYTKGNAAWISKKITTDMMHEDEFFTKMREMGCIEIKEED